MTKSKDTASLKTLAAPKPGQSYGASKTRRRTVTSGHAARPVKGLVQFNVKIRARARHRFDELFDRVGENMTKGELLEAMIEAYASGRVGTETAPPDEDIEAGRSEAMVVHFVPELSDALQRRASRNGWTVSATIEHACAVAADAEEAQEMSKGNGGEPSSAEKTVG